MALSWEVYASPAWPREQCCFGRGSRCTTADRLGSGMENDPDLGKSGDEERFDLNAIVMIDAREQGKAQN